MSRKRDIKPSFFTNEELAELPRDVRLFFIGLWPIADREGRLELRPKRIKRDVFPYDVDVTEKTIEEWLAILANHPSRFVTIYAVGDGRYIQIKNFKKHQDLHPRETASELPGPPKAEPVQPKAEQNTPLPEQAPKEIANFPLPSFPSLPSGTLDSPSARACAIPGATEPVVRTRPQTPDKLIHCLRVAIEREQPENGMWNPGNSFSTKEADRFLAGFTDLEAALPEIEKRIQLFAKDKSMSPWTVKKFVDEYNGIGQPKTKDRSASGNSQRQVIYDEI